MDGKQPVADARLHLLRATCPLPDLHDNSADLPVALRAELIRRVEAFIAQRRSGAQPAPPTYIRMLWGRSSAAAMPILVLLSQHSVYRPRHDRSRQCQTGALLALAGEAWSAVHPAGIRCLLSAPVWLQVSREDTGPYPLQYAALVREAMPLSTVLQGG